MSNISHTIYPQSSSTTFFNAEIIQDDVTPTQSPVSYLPLKTATHSSL